MVRNLIRKVQFYTFQTPATWVGMLRNPTRIRSEFIPGRVWSGILSPPPEKPKNWVDMVRIIVPKTEELHDFTSNSLRTGWVSAEMSEPIDGRHPPDYWVGMVRIMHICVLGKVNL